MSFGGLDFIFDGQYSGNYDLKIMSINGSSLTSDASAGCGIEVFTDWVYRNPTAYHQGVAQNEPLEFELELVSEDELSGIMRSKISKWLFGRMDFCKLQIVQRDLQDVYFNCHLIDPQLTYIGNYCHGISCKVQCDAPWAWQYEKTYEISPSKEEMTDAISYTWRHYNDSDNTDYTYPVIEFKMNDSFVGKGRCSIINENDNGREFLFNELSPGEIVIVDCESKTISSSTGLLRSENFNKKFLRLVSGVNTLQFIGEFSYFKMTYKNARKVGG